MSGKLRLNINKKSVEENHQVEVEEVQEVEEIHQEEVKKDDDIEAMMEEIKRQELLLEINKSGENNE